MRIIFGYIYSKSMRIPFPSTSFCFYENISSLSSTFTFISNYLCTVQFVSYEGLWEDNCCTISREGFSQCQLKNPNILPLTNDPEILIGFKMSNYITAFLYRSFWLQIIHFFHPASHNYSIFIPALTSFFHSPLICSRCDISGKLKKALRPAIQSFMNKRNFTPSSAILVSLNYVLIVLREYYSSSGV